MSVFNISVNLTVVAKTQEEAEKNIKDFFNMSFKEFATENKINTFELMDVYEEFGSCLEQDT